MAVVITILVVAVVIAIVAAVLLRRRGSGVAEPAPRRSSIPPAAPMTGLESALDQVTDREGRSLRDKIEGGTAIDDLRIADDSGPILRRALDQVEHTHVDHGHVDAGDLPPATETPVTGPDNPEPA